jgi:hypothetical protein
MKFLQSEEVFMASEPEADLCFFSSLGLLETKIHAI